MQIRPFVLTARLAGCAASRAKNKSLSDFFAPAPRRGAAFYKLEYLILNRKRKNVRRWIKPQKTCLIFFAPAPSTTASGEVRPRRPRASSAIDTVAGIGDRRLAASGSDSAGRRGRGRATDRKGGAVALIRARTRKSLSRVRFLAHRTLSRRRRMTESDALPPSAIQSSCVAVFLSSALSRHRGQAPWRSSY